MNDRPAAARQALEQAALRLGQGDEALFEAVLAGVAQVAGAGRVRLLAAGPGKNEWRLLAGHGHAGVGDETLPLALIQRALAGGQVCYSDPADGPAHDLVVPARYGDRPLGFVHAGQLSRPAAEADEPALLALASLAAAALDRANLAASLEANERDRRDFVSLTTHQLRVPLTSISGFTDLMLTGIAGSLTERQEQFMRTVQRNVGRMTTLIADLSDLNRIADGRMPFNKSAFPLKALIEAVLHEQAKAIEGRGHLLERRLPDGLPPAHGDQAAVKRVFEKILDNAIRYTPEGGQLSVTAVYHDRRLQVTVTDNGIGIDPGDQARLFTPFFRSEVEAVREHTGWGLSLAVARALLEAQGGQLWLESEPGNGTIFHFTLPVAGSETPPGASRSQDE